ncbi:hypothetical protein LZ32DRAFT_175552 [Colletotrichum eremochloae]|nr:hypothetical protein LZ32DRAFT_175552 [Colletotrichum eremochloae]
MRWQSSLPLPLSPSHSFYPSLSLASHSVAVTLGPRASPPILQDIRHRNVPPGPGITSPQPMRGTGAFQVRRHRLMSCKLGSLSLSAQGPPSAMSAIEMSEQMSPAPRSLPLRREEEIN